MDTGTPIAFLGLGAMGRPMALRLIEAGYQVTVWNRTAARAAGLVAAGARQAATPREAAAVARVIFLMLADTAAVAAVLDGDDGVLRGARPGTVVVNTSTIGPADSRRFAAQCMAASLRYLESPVMGSLGQAASGTLVALTSGDPAAIGDVSGVLLVLAKRIVQAGEHGHASTLKLAMNLLVAGITELLGESIAVAHRSGLPLDLLRDTLMSSVLASPFIGYKAPQLLERQYEPLFSARLLVKDLDLLLASAQDVGVRLPATSAVREQYARAVAEGLGDRDMAVVREVLDRTP